MRASKICFIKIISFVSALWFWTNASAAEIRKIPATVGGNIILIAGTVEPGDAQRFANIALSATEAVVVLKSPGGALSDALDIGRAIRIKRFLTYVPDHAECASACALIWLAGATRAISSSAKVGFHAAYLESKGIKSVASAGNALVGSYLNSLGFSDQAVIYVTAAPPDTVLWLTKTTAEKIGITFAIYDTEAQQDEAPTNANRKAKTVISEFLSIDGADDLPGSGPVKKALPRPLETTATHSIQQPNGPYNPTYLAVGLEENALRFIQRYLQLEDLDAPASIQLMSLSYDDPSFHYGRSKTRNEIAIEYAKFSVRWPLRKHTLRSDSAVITCTTQAERCVIDGIIDWEASSPVRNEKSKGISSWHVVLRKEGNQFRITAVDGKVMERQKSALGQNTGFCFGALCLLSGSDTGQR